MASESGATGETVAPEGFEDFLLERQARLVRSAFLLTGSWHSAEDLVQEVFVRMFRTWGTLRDPAAADAYAHRTMIRLHARHRRRFWHREHPTAEPPQAPRAEASVNGRLEDDVSAALQALTTSERAIVVLRYFCDLDVSTTASMVGCSAGTVKSQSSRARSTLQRMLAGYSPEAGTTREDPRHAHRG